ncbi:MAG: hypothetical protein GXP63_06590 [DPANN group archaeon]|nr:hypothetical protein [DPANN group archaeon]
MEKSKQSKQAIYLIMTTELVKEKQEQPSDRRDDSASASTSAGESGQSNESIVLYEPMIKAANLNDVLKWNMIELKDYMLNNEPDLVGDMYQKGPQETATVVRDFYQKVTENPGRFRADLYLFPKDTGETVKIMVRPFDTVADFADRVIGEQTPDIDGMELTDKVLAGMFLLVDGLGSLGSLSNAPRMDAPNLYRLLAAYGQ